MPDKPAPHAQLAPFRPGDLALPLGVSDHTVRRWAREGRIASFRTAGGHVRIPRDAAQDLLRRAGDQEGGTHAGA